jgi:hypothetical protein
MNIINIKMTTEELNRLLGKYYNGDSSEEEERILREYFAKDEIPEDYDAEKIIFGYYASAGDIPEPSADFEARIISGIDRVESGKVSGKFRKHILPFLGAAAGILILTGSLIFFVHKREISDTYSDPEIAYAETMKILFDVSSRLNYGSKILEPVNKINEITAESFRTINKKTLLVDESLKNLGHLQRIKDSPDAMDKKMINK